MQRGTVLVVDSVQDFLASLRDVIVLLHRRCFVQPIEQKMRQRAVIFDDEGIVLIVAGECSRECCGWWRRRGRLVQCWKSGSGGSGGSRGGWTDRVLIHSNRCPMFRQILPHACKITTQTKQQIESECTFLPTVWSPYPPPHALNILLPLATCGATGTCTQLPYPKETNKKQIRLHST